MARRKDVSRIALGDQELLVVEVDSAPLILEELTESENAVVRMVVAGKSNKEIADEREVSTKTVANQLRAIYEKLRITSRFELVALVESRR
jgi:DNA-binding NarL/FixJ family response regulator